MQLISLNQLNQRLKWMFCKKNNNKRIKKKLQIDNQYIVGDYNSASASPFLIEIDL